MEGLFSLLLFAGFFYFMMRFGCGAHMVHGHGRHAGHGRDAQGQPPVSAASTDPAPESGALSHVPYVDRVPS